MHEAWELWKVEKKLHKNKNICVSAFESSINLLPHARALHCSYYWNEQYCVHNTCIHSIWYIIHSTYILIGECEREIVCRMRWYAMRLYGVWPSLPGADVLRDENTNNNHVYSIIFHSHLEWSRICKNT